MSKLEPTRTYSNPTATDVLRRMLDERGVEYDTDDEDGCEFTEWVANGLEWEADSRGELVYLTPVMLITPEQAIAATLGSCNCSNNCTSSERTETCEMEYVSDWMSWHCKSCDHMDMAPRNPKPRYCKWCGRKVVSE